MTTGPFLRRLSSGYSFILVSLLTLIGILSGCGSSSTSGSSHTGGLTPTPTTARQIKGTISEFPLKPGYQPGNITAGPDGNLWFIEVDPAAQSSGNTLTSKIGRITPSGVVNEFTLSSNSYAGDITTGPDGNLWFTTETTTNNPTKHTQHITSTIGRITPSGTISEFPLSPGILAKYITSGSDGNLWFTEIGPYPINEGVTIEKIGRITPSGKISEFPLPAGKNSGLGLMSITNGPDGNLWFTESGKIGRITPSGTISEFPLPAGNQPGRITAGPDNALWFIETASNPTTQKASGKIGRISLTGTISEFSLTADNQSGSFIVALGISTGPDGNLWFTRVSPDTQNGVTTLNSKIGRITPAGIISEFPLSATSYAGDITTGPDGNLWFTEWNNKAWSGKIGRLA